MKKLLRLGIAALYVLCLLAVAVFFTDFGTPIRHTLAKAAPTACSWAYVVDEGQSVWDTIHNSCAHAGENAAYAAWFIPKLETFRANAVLTSNFSPYGLAPTSNASLLLQMRHAGIIIR